MKQLSDFPIWQIVACDRVSGKFYCLVLIPVALCMFGSNFFNSRWSYSVTAQQRHRRHKVIFFYWLPVHDPRVHEKACVCIAHSKKKYPRIATKYCPHDLELQRFCCDSKAHLLYNAQICICICYGITSIHNACVRLLLWCIKTTISKDKFTWMAHRVRIARSTTNGWQVHRKRTHVLARATCKN